MPSKYLSPIAVLALFKQGKIDLTQDDLRCLRLPNGNQNALRVSKAEVAKAEKENRRPVPCAPWLLSDIFSI